MSSRRRSAPWVTGLVGRRPLNAGGSTFLGTLNSRQAGRRGILMTTERMDAEGRLRLMPHRSPENRFMRPSHGGLNGTAEIQPRQVFSVRADTEAAAVLVRARRWCGPPEIADQPVRFDAWKQGERSVPWNDEAA